MSGVTRISSERLRQITEEGFTPEHDSEHEDCSLAFAAMLYVEAATVVANAPAVIAMLEAQAAEAVSNGNKDRERNMLEGAKEWRHNPIGTHYGNKAPHRWPWEPEAWKPSNDPIRNLEKAGALIAAEIDRLEADYGPETSSQDR